MRLLSVPLMCLLLVHTSFAPHAPARAQAAAGSGGWTATTVAQRALAGVSAPTTTHVWAVGAAGTVVVSSDAGATWRSQSAGVSNDLAGVSFVDETHGWAVGADDRVTSTRDGGATWKASRTGSGAGSMLRGVDFVDRTHGWVVGNTAFPALTSVVMATADGGATWTRQSTPAGIGLLSVSFAGPLHGFTAGYLGAGYRTDDGGRTWVPMQVGSGASVNAVVRVNALVGFAAALREVYRTDDGGQTWTLLAAFDRTLRGLTAAGGAVVAVGDGGLVARSDDDGETWALQAAGTRGDLAAVSAPTASFAVAVGTNTLGGGGVAATYRAGDAASPPLDVGENDERCDPGLTVRWASEAAGYVVSAATGDLDGDGGTDIVVSGTEGIRALRPYRPTAQATLWYRPFQARVRTVLLAELDGDGGPEVLAASLQSGDTRSGVVALDGGDGAVLWSRRVSGGAGLLRATDVDGDGRQDAVVLTGGDALQVLSGTDGHELVPARPLGAQPTHLALADLGGDGIDDAVVTFRDGRAVAFDLARGHQLWTYKAESGALEAVAVADLNGDGRPDVVVAGAGVAQSLTSPDTDGSRSIGTRVGPLVAALDGRDGRRLWDFGEADGGGRVAAVAVGDVTRDGRPDVIAQATRLGASRLLAFDGAGRQHLGAQTGEPVALWSYPTTRGGDGVQAVYDPDALVAGDGDGDGVADVYLGSWNSTLLAVSGGRVQPAVGLGLPRAEGMWEVSRPPLHAHVSLLVGDGRPLVLSAAGDQLVSLRDAATGAVDWAYDAGGRPALAVGDFDGDGLPAIGAGTTAGRVYGLGPDGALLRPDVDVFLPHRTRALVAVDVDRDGTQELVAASAEGAVEAVDPDDGRVLWQVDVEKPVASAAAATGVVAIGTSDGTVQGLDAATGAVSWEHAGDGSVGTLAYVPDRRLFAAGDSTGGLRLLTTAGDLVAEGSTDGAGFTALAVADVDGDGSSDVAAAAGFGFSAFAVTGERLWHHPTAQAATHVAAGDLDADGAADVLGAGYDGKAHALDGRSGRSLWAIANGMPGPLVGADLDGQGVTVAVVSSPIGPDGQHLVRAVDVGGRVLATCTLRKAPHAIATADLDGDGVVELIVTMVQGDVYALSGPRSAPLP